MEWDERNLVLVLGEFPLSEVPFAERNLHVEHVTADAAPGFFNKARALVVADFADKFGLIRIGYSGLFDSARDHGLAHVVIAHTEPNFLEAQRLKPKDCGDSVARIYLVEHISKAAEFIARYQVGPPAGDVTIEPDTVVLSDEERLLLRCAFSDCRKIVLEPITGGKASKGVFRAHAWLRRLRRRATSASLLCKSCYARNS